MSEQPAPEGITQTAFFETIYSNDKRLERFVLALTGLSSGPAQILTQKFPWESYDSLCDVGTPEGIVPATIAGECEHLTGPSSMVIGSK